MANTLHTYTLPAYWASYLINGDDSGISPVDVEQAEKFLADNNLPLPVAVGESYFSWRNDANTTLGDDVADYTFIV